MGRRKIVIEKIKDDKTRQVTFLKRKKGLLKKARELAVLCDCNIEVIIFGNNGQLYEFSSQAPGEIFERYSNYRGISEVWTADGNDKGKKIHVDLASGNQEMSEALRRASRAALGHRPTPSNLIEVPGLKEEPEEESDDSDDDNDVAETGKANGLGAKLGSKSAVRKRQEQMPSFLANNAISNSNATGNATAAPTAAATANASATATANVAQPTSLLKRGSLTIPSVPAAVGRGPPFDVMGRRPSATYGRQDATPWQMPTGPNEPEDSVGSRRKLNHLKVEIPEHRPETMAAPSGTFPLTMRAYTPSSITNWAGNWTPTANLPSATGEGFHGPGGISEFLFENPGVGVGTPYLTLPSPSNAGLLTSRAGSIIGKRLGESAFVSANETLAQRPRLNM
eukprot:CAMPEP_0184752990 /NCGR_PEP_ID=MMETSP0315-20130426/43867_1 /TAXON_ID=101924 /ORGANISM="Rhodosorus marinus, Strain UTEX LB 2760" /LENGTH=395 /DNA_ID=CAMNT_0027232349 /DNA_START=1068 /DNA_END=2255 /DNA_ORIENTATION=+